MNRVDLESRTGWPNSFSHLDLAASDLNASNEVARDGYLDWFGNNACDYAPAVKRADNLQKDELTGRWGGHTWAVYELSGLGLQDARYGLELNNSTACVWPLYDGEKSLFVWQANPNTMTNLTEVARNLLPPDASEQDEFKLNQILVNGSSGTSPYKSPVSYNNYEIFPKLNEQGDYCTSKKPAVVAFDVDTGIGQVEIDLSSLDNPGTRVVRIDVGRALEILEGSTASECPTAAVEGDPLEITLPQTSDTTMLGSEYSEVPIGPAVNPPMVNGEELDASINNPLTSALSEAFEGASGGEVDCNPQCITENMIENTVTFSGVLNVDDPVQRDAVINGEAAGCLFGGFVVVVAGFRIWLNRRK